MQNAKEESGTVSMVFMPFTGIKNICTIIGIIPYLREEKQQLEIKRQKQREKEEKELQDSIMRLAMIMGSCLGLNMRSNQKKYHGVYDENGLPKIS